MSRSPFLLLAFVLLAAPVSADVTNVRIGHNSITPTEIETHVGETVRFHNVDAMPGGHTVVADDGSFESPPLAKDEDYEHVFEKEGRVAIRIKQHPNATAIIVVGPAHDD